MNLIRFFNKCKRGWDIVSLKAKPSYAQAGEDIIVNYLFASLAISKPSYLEIGTNQPVLHNNTYFFYHKGGKGVCIEPDPEMYKTIVKKRPNDIVLNVGIGAGLENDNATFYLFPGQFSAWSTFSESEACIRETEGNVTAKKIFVPIKNINEIIKTHFGTAPNYISVDVEGMDLDILKSIDFGLYKPEVICVETITFSLNNTETKIGAITEFMLAKGYNVYADTHINTIYCREDIFEKNGK